MIIRKVYVEKFRKLSDQEFVLGKKLTVIAGQNGTMKSTLLGMIGQPFSMKDKANPISKAKTIDGYLFESKYGDKFKFSMDHDKAGDHKWKLFLADRTIYPKESFEAVSNVRKEKGLPDSIRIESTGGRKSGMGYIQCPVQFLSLKRLIPIGEERTINTSEVELSVEEKVFFREYHSKILLIDDEMEDVEHIKSSNKSSLGAKTKFYDSLTNSAGQDNVGKILLAILSFKRLKENYPENYKGGILLIDEIDATMYPKAQVQLIKYLFRFASDYSLQIILTTHSIHVLDTVLQSDYKRDSTVLYMRNREKGIIVDVNPVIEQIEADLNVRTVPELKYKKLRIYCEDAEARIFINNLIPKGYKKKVDLMSVSLGCDNLKQLQTRGVPEFNITMIILDGDSTIPKNAKNICKLPGQGKSPEYILFDFLKNLPDQDQFWPYDIGNYSKQICFEDFPSLERPNNRVEYKKWFNDQSKYWGKNCSSLFSRWKKDNLLEVKQFEEAFIKIYDYLMTDTNESI